MKRVAAMWVAFCREYNYVGRRDHRKPFWQSSISGSKAEAWMRKLRPLMGTRRQGQIDAALGDVK